MEISKGLTAAINDLGFPIVLALLAALALWKLSSWLLKFFNQLVGDQAKDRMETIERIKTETVKAIEDLQQELDEEQQYTRKEISEIKIMVVRLIVFAYLLKKFMTMTLQQELCGTLIPREKNIEHAQSVGKN